MTQSIFLQQIKELQDHFGEKQFSPGFVRRVWDEVHEMSDYAFKRFVDQMIGHRPQNRPPLMAEFREALLAWRKDNLRRETDGAVLSMRRAPDGDLAKVLDVEFGAKSVMEAFRKARKGDGEGA